MAPRKPNYNKTTFYNDSVSTYTSKATNLSKRQLKAAGATKKATSRKVDISSTTRATSGANKGKTLGPGGKPLTGTVKLPGGETAVYQNGKRVRMSQVKPAKPAKPAPVRSSAPTRAAAPVNNRPAKKTAKPAVSRPSAAKLAAIEGANTRRPVMGPSADTVSSQSRKPKHRVNVRVGPVRIGLG